MIPRFMLRISRLLYATEHACGRMNWLDSRWSALSAAWTFIRHNIWWRRHGGFTFSVRVCGILMLGLGFWRHAPSRGEHVCLIQRLPKMTAVGFEPTPFRTVAPEASALDHSAKPSQYFSVKWYLNALSERHSTTTWWRWRRAMHGWYN